MKALKFRKTGDRYVVSLARGERLVESFGSFLLKSGVRGGSVTGLGAVDRAELGFYDLGRKEFRWRTFEQDLEIASLVGIVTEAGLHAHVVLSDSGYRCVGGHLREARVSGACELVVTELPPLARKHDGVTGLRLLDL